jgi:hypothetical protein
MNEIKIPTTWDEVTIGQWQEISNIETDLPETKDIETIAILADIDPEEIRQLNIKTYQSLKEKLRILSDSPISTEMKLKIELNGRKYGFIPNLDFITAGEWADINQWSNDSVDNLHLISAVLYRPIIKEDDDNYEIAPHLPNGFMQRAELFKKELPITAVYQSIFFFISFGIEYMRILTEYLTEEELEKKKKTSKKTTTQKATKRKRDKPSKNNGEHMIS